MKKILLIGVLLMGMFFLVACEKKIEEELDLLSVLKTLELPEIDLLENESGDSLKTDLYFPKSVETEHGTVLIFWATSNYLAIDSDGRVHRGVSKDRNVELVPSLALRGRSWTRTDLTENYVVLAYSFADFVMPEIVLTLGDSINDIKGDIVLPQSAVVEGETVVIIWQIEVDNKFKNILQIDGSVSRHTSIRNEQAKISLLPVIYHNEDMLELVDYRVDIYVTPYGIEESMEISMDYFPEIIYAEGDQANSITQDIYHIPSIWLLYDGVYIDLIWEASEVGTIEVSGTTGKVTFSDQSKTVMLTPTLNYSYYDKDDKLVEVSREHSEKQIQIFVHGTTIPDDLSGYSFRNGEKELTIIFDNEKDITLSKGNRHVNYSTKGTYTLTGLHITITFTQDLNLLTIFGLERETNLTIGSNYLQLELPSSKEMIELFEAGETFYGPVETNQSQHYGTYGKLGLGYIKVSGYTITVEGYFGTITSNDYIMYTGAILFKKIVDEVTITYVVFKSSRGLVLFDIEYLKQ